MGAEDRTENDPAPDARIQDLKRRLDEALLDINHGEYFRARIMGWIAHLSDVELPFPTGVAERLGEHYPFPNEDVESISAVDAFVIAYHAAETYFRLLLALYRGGVHPQASPLISMAELKAGPELNPGVRVFAGLDDEPLTKILDFLFLPDEVKAAWPEGAASSVDEVQEYLRLWCRALGAFLDEWRNAYNAAKHGLAVAARPTTFTFVATDPPIPPTELGSGLMLRTVEHEDEKDANGKTVKKDGKPVRLWCWVFRSIDPEEFIAQAIVTASLLDGLRSVARSRLLQHQDGVWVPIYAAPKPRDVRRPTSALRTLRMPLTAAPLPPEQAAAVLADLERAIAEEEIPDEEVSGEEVSDEQSPAEGQGPVGDQP